jgi:hypothetical protein
MTNEQLFDVAVMLVTDMAMLSRSPIWDASSDEAKAMDADAQKAIAAYEAATGNDFWEDFNADEMGI